MKNATKVMYTIGKIFTILEIIGAVLVLTLGIVAATNSAAVFEQAIADGYSKFESAAQVKAAGVMIIIAFAIVLVVESVVLYFAERARKAVEQDEKATTPHIIMVVLGVFSNIFYLLGGVFGLAAADRK